MAWTAAVLNVTNLLCCIFDLQNGYYLYPNILTSICNPFDNTYSSLFSPFYCARSNITPIYGAISRADITTEFFIIKMFGGDLKETAC